MRSIIRESTVLDVHGVRLLPYSFVVRGPHPSEALAELAAGGLYESKLQCHQPPYPTTQIREKNNTDINHLRHLTDRAFIHNRY